MDFVFSWKCEKIEVLLLFGSKKPENRSDSSWEKVVVGRYALLYGLHRKIVLTAICNGCIVWVYKHNHHNCRGRHHFTCGTLMVDGNNYCVWGEEAQISNYESIEWWWFWLLVQNERFGIFCSILINFKPYILRKSFKLCVIDSDF